MIEVEAKIAIPNPKHLREKIQKLARYKGTELKVDEYYALDSSKKSYPTKSLRVRHHKGIYEVNFKQKLSYIKGVHAKREVEFPVSDIEGFLALIKDFGFIKWLTKEKRSEIYEVSKYVHIELNHVMHLGWFLEIEYLTNEKGITEARAKVLELVKSLGYKEKDIVKQGYTKLLWDLHNA